MVDILFKLHYRKVGQTANTSNSCRVQVDSVTSLGDEDMESSESLAPVKAMFHAMSDDLGHDPEQLAHVTIEVTRLWSARW